MIRLAALGALLLTLPQAAVAAQDKARLDDFAAPASPGGIEIGHVAPVTRALAAEQATDRSVETPLAAKPVVQLSDRPNGVKDRTPVVQVAPLDDRAAQAAPPLSKREDGRSTGTERLAGDDRCDPQARTAERDEACRRILELRAREFSATEAPKLSAEQELLARQFRQSSASLADTVEQDRTDRTMPNADERAAQELGFLVLPVPRQEEPLPETDPGVGNLSEALKGVLIELGVRP